MCRVDRAGGRWWTVWFLVVMLLASTLAPAPWRDPSHSPPLGLDKWYHFVTHAALTAALVRATGRRDRLQSVAAAVLVSAVYGVLLELGQTRVPGRQYEPGDVVAGALGALVGGVAVSGGRSSGRRPGRSPE